MKLGNRHGISANENNGDTKSDRKNSSTLNQDLSHHDYSVEENIVQVKTILEALLELMIINFSSQTKKLAQ